MTDPTTQLSVMALQLGRAEADRDDWHKLADERSAEIVRLTEERDHLRAAREAAEKRAEMLETCHAPNLRVQAAEARVKELTEESEALLRGNRTASARMLAAESALASARTAIEHALTGYDWNQFDDPHQNATGKELEAWLASHPAAATEAADKGEV